MEFGGVGFEAIRVGMNVASDGAVFQWPTTGYIGTLFGCGHPGLDIWTNATQTGRPTFGFKGNAVYPVYPGVVDKVGWDHRTPSAKMWISIDHGIVGGVHLWTRYFHLADEATATSYIEPDIVEGRLVDRETLLGYQGDRRFNTDKGESRITHLHLVVQTQQLDGGEISPTPYLGMSLSCEDKEPVPSNETVYVQNPATACRSSWGILVCEDPNGGGNNLGFNTPWQSSALSYNLGVSSIGVAPGWAVVLESWPQSPSTPCLTLDHSVQNLAPYTFSDGSPVEDRVASVQPLYAVCPAVCSNRGIQSRAAAVESTLSEGICSIQPTPTPQPDPLAPFLITPPDNATPTNRDMSFDWDPPSNLSPDGYTFRIRTTSNMELNSGGETVLDTGVGPSEYRYTLDPKWDNKDLYWSVRACKPCTPYNPGAWATMRKFKISPSSEPNGVTFYDGVNHQAPSITLTEGKYNNLADYGWYDRIESVKVSGSYAGRYHVVLHTETNQGGTPYHLEGDVADIGDPFRNRIRSIEIYDRAPNGGVELCNDTNYGGGCKIFTEGNQNDLGDWKDRAESLRFVGNYIGRYQVVMYDQINMGGTPVYYGADSPDVGPTWRNKFRSMKIYFKNHAPNTPTLVSPGDGAVIVSTAAPTLCWNQSGDQDGDAVNYYAEVYDSALNPSSGLQSGTCWRPSQLDAQYGAYRWHVRARDSRGSDSSWSQTWTFTLENPNKPPVISFTTANGDGFPSGIIFSRQQNWTFAGTASDPEGQLDRVEFQCVGDNCGSQVGHTGAATWSHTQNGMSGQNDVYFVAYDGINQGTASRHLDLRIDLAAPATTPSLNAEANPDRWPAWFTVPVQVDLAAEDGATGHARSGVREVHYRLDGGDWQTQASATATFSVSSDGSHTVEYYAVDNVGNQEATGSVSFGIDQAPPSPPAGVAETHGVISDQWQREQNTPTFTWAASADATSGIWGYQFNFDTNPDGEGYQTFLASDPREWTPQPDGVRTATYYLRGRTRDNAGNWSPWADLFTFRYDGTPPENPNGATHAAGADGVPNDTWQRISNQPDFAWPVPHDEGSGVQGYRVYWGADPAGASEQFITENRFASGQPLCGTDQACTGYLRLRSLDNVGNAADDWSTAFILRYDNAPPIADFTFSGGTTETTQTLIRLDLAATDEGSGVREMRLSGDAGEWLPWEAYAAERMWTLPPISRQSWPVYLQVRDGVGLESEVISHSIYLDVNARQPRSASFRLFDHALSAGSGDYASPSFSGRGTLGQVMDAPVSISTSYSLASGYEAGSRAIPIIEPGHDEFTFINGIFASGTGANTLTSPAYRMLSTVGEIGLPNNETTLLSQSHQHQPGFLAAAPPPPSPSPTPTPGPTPTPTPAPACEHPSVTINNGADFTYDPHVTLSLCAPWATEMMISSEETFTGAQWEPFAASKPWLLTTAGQQVLPRFVYAAFRETNGTVHATYIDDIIYDPNPPSGTLNVGDSVPAQAMARSQEVTAATAGKPLAASPMKYVASIEGKALSQPLALLAPRSDGAVDLYINARDDNSGLTEMQVSSDAGFSGAAWEPYSALRPWTPEGGDGEKSVYARFRDGAANVSAPANASFALDTTPPMGGIALQDRVVGPNTVAMTVYLGAVDNLSGVADMRLSQDLDPGLAGAAWQPYATTAIWPISLTTQTEGVVHVQYRDLAGNASEVYTDTFVVDTTPPEMYVNVQPGETLTRDIQVLAYDTWSTVTTMRLTNDPLLVEGVVTMPYAETVSWTFDDRRVVWVQVQDAVGNWNEARPAYAAPVFAPQAPAATISLDGLPTVAWTHLDINEHYEVWRDSRPYFDPAAPTADTVKLADVSPPYGGGTMTYRDITADANTTYYYALVGVNPLSQASLPSNCVGLFRFGLTPGQ